jgi:RNA polymerase sigma factor (sigma-70 family)
VVNSGQLRERNEGLHEPIIELIPALRAFARSLTRDPTEADDLVQETLMKAIANTDKFEPGTRLRSWLFTIMRNTFSTRYIKMKREPTGRTECVSTTQRGEAAQQWSLELREVLAAVQRLPRANREVLVLVAMLDTSYEEMARICECPVGTIKSRLNRARRQLREMLDAPPKSTRRVEPRREAAAAFRTL